LPSNQMLLSVSAHCEEEVRAGQRLESRQKGRMTSERGTHVAALRALVLEGLQLARVAARVLAAEDNLRARLALGRDVEAELVLGELAGGDEVVNEVGLTKLWERM